MILTPTHLILAILFAVGIYRRYRVFTKVELKRISGPASESFWRGTLPRLFNVNGWDYHRHLWRTYGPVIRVKGFLGQNQLYVYDPRALHHIFIKDQLIWEPSPAFVAGAHLVFGGGLAGTVGTRHRKQRKLLNPVFNTNHLRQMVPVFYEIVHKMESSIANQVMAGPKEVDILAWLGRTSLELIGQSGFSRSFDELKEEVYDSPYITALKEISHVTYKLAWLRVYALHHLVKIGSPEFRRKMIDYLPSPALREARTLVDELYKTALEIYQSKKKMLLENSAGLSTLEMGRGKDILSILMKANMEAAEEDRLSDEEVCGQISTFIFAGTDTTSGAVARIIWVLSRRKDVQDKLRDEIRQAMRRAGDSDIPHDDLVALPYLDAVCRETLRLHSPLWSIIRKPNQDVILPLSRPITDMDGRTLNEIFIPQGTTVMCGLLASNVNPEIWGPDAAEWKPERWINGVDEKVVEARLPGVYSHLMSFSGGNRGCIGFKFSQLEMKVMLAVIFSRFEFSPSQDITWRMTNISTPVVTEGDHSKPSLPLIVKLAT